MDVDIPVGAAASVAAVAAAAEQDEERDQDKHYFHSHAGRLGLGRAVNATSGGEEVCLTSSPERLSVCSSQGLEHESAAPSFPPTPLFSSRLVATSTSVNLLLSDFACPRRPLVAR